VIPIYILFHYSVEKKLRDSWIDLETYKKILNLFLKVSDFELVFFYFLLQEVFPSSLWWDFVLKKSSFSSLKEEFILLLLSSAVTEMLDIFKFIYALVLYLNLNYRKFDM
jgi:hypothetical protein